MRIAALQPVDERMAASLQSFVPARVFDAHAHLYRMCDVGSVKSPLMDAFPAELTAGDWREALSQQLGAGRLVGGLFMPWPVRDGATVDANQYLLAQLERVPESRGSILIRPEWTEKEVTALLDHPQVVGLKPYHRFAPEEPTFQAPLSAYLPEWAWRLADARGLAITIHLVRDGALADRENLDEIRRMGRRYPGARVILAHAARGFHAPNTVKAVGQLAGLENVFFDTAAVCESAPLEAILRWFGPGKLLWGSDFTVSHQRGRAVTAGDGFAWICPERVDGGADAPECHATLVGFEALRALEEAADAASLSKADLCDVFHDNAARLFGLLDEPGNRTQGLYEHAKERIPGGTQLLSKRPEMLAPDQWPAYFREARGCEIWDLDGRHFYDLSIHGIGACLLGYRDPDVTRAVLRRVRLGSFCTLNPPDEVALADRLCAIHPWADQARFTRCGGEAAVVAVRIARATTRRSHVAICGYHGWHDWYLAANLGESDALMGHLLPGLDPLGVPKELRGTARTFAYERRDAFDAILEDHGDDLAAVVMEPMRHHLPEAGFLEYVRDRAHRAGALIIYDEITIGWRLCYGGAHLRLGVAPDMAVLAKALGNGHPIGAVIGTRAAMEGAHGSFISSTYWTEGVGPAAALATLDKMARVDVPPYIEGVGQRAKAAWRAAAQRHGLPVVVDDGVDCLAHFKFDHPKTDALRTLYAQLMLGRGFLAGTALYCTMAHTDEIIAMYAEAIDEVFAEIAAILSADAVEKALRGPVAHTGFRRLL